MPFSRSRRFLLVLILVGLFPALVGADEVQLKPDHPERYTVAKGDTLWTIAARFLRSPWHWPRVWKINDKIKNPHLIYPGDVILLRYVDGKPELTVLRNEKVSPSDSMDVAADSAPMPAAADSATPLPVSSGDNTTKLTPQVYSESVERPIPTVTPDIIAPFLTQPLAIDPAELKRAGYVTVGFDKRIALGNQSIFYARGLQDPNAEYYRIFRPGKALRHPDTGEILAYEALYLGDAQRLEKGDPAKLIVTSVKQEIVPTDRLLVAPADAGLPYYFPRSPGKPLKGRIVAALNAVAEIGSHTVVAVSLGQREGVEEGHVLRVLYHQGTHKDPVSGRRYELPDEDAALLLVFRTFEKVSYALVLNATQPVHLLDVVTTP